MGESSHRKACAINCHTGPNLNAIHLSLRKLDLYAPEIGPLRHIHYSALPLHNACSRHTQLHACSVLKTCSTITATVELPSVETVRNTASLACHL